MNKDYDFQTLADLVVCVARTDTTEPDPANLRNGWATDLLLSQMIDKFVIQKHNNPDVLAIIAWKVLVEMEGLPEAAAMAKIAIFRADRLMPLTADSEKSILLRIKQLERDIAALPDGPRKMRCQSLFQYHQGFLYDACGRFNMAAKLQLQSAMTAMVAGDNNSFTIGTFMAGIFNLKNLLRLGKPVDSAFASIESHFESFVVELRGSPLEVLWAQVNGPVFMIEACVWLDRGKHPKWHQWVETSLKGMEQLGSSWDLCADFVRAVDMEKYDPSPGAAESALSRVAESNDANERRAAALLILARHAVAEGRAKDARKLIARMPEQGAQHVVAVAKRCIKQ